MSYDPKEFFDARFRHYGHTGDVDAVVYAHDQPMRVRAILRAITSARIPVSPASRVLDFGCGTGDVMAALVRLGPPALTGIDISPEVICHARQRFADCPTVRLFAVDIQSAAFEPGSFDFAIGINVLQHILDDADFRKTAERVVELVTAGGHVIVMDFSPIRVKKRNPAPYVTVRSRDEYVRCFESLRCRLIHERGLPRLGIRLYRGIRAPLAAKRVLLRATRVIDESFAGLSRPFTDMRILVLQKQ